MSGLVEFLRARYTEAREAEVGRRAIPGWLPFRWTAVYEKDRPHVLIDGVRRVAMDDFMEEYGESSADPTVLADLDSKLRIVDLMSGLLAAARNDSEVDHYGALSVAEDTLALLVLPFADHPDYREEWKP